MKKIYKLIKPWLLPFGIALLLLLCNIIIRTIEPKLLQATIEVLQYGKINASDRFLSTIQQLLSVLNTATIQSKILALGLIFICLAAMRSTLGLLSKSISIKASEQAMYKLRTDLFHHIQRLPVGAFEKINKGELIQRSSGDMETIKNFLSNQSVELFRLIVTASFAIIMLFVIHWKFALLSLVLSPIILTISILFFKYESKVWEAHEEEADKLTNIVQENLNGLKTIQAYWKQDFEIKKFEVQNQRKYQAGMKNALLHTFYWPTMDFLSLTQTLFIICIGGYFVYMGEMRVSELATCYSYAGMISWPLKMIGRVLGQMGMAFVAVDRIEEIFIEPKEILKGRKDVSIHETIYFENIDFTYSKDSKMILNQIHFDVQQGEKIALMGTSGSGKSTLMKLLLRLYEPTKGRIRIGETPLEDIHQQYLRSKIGFVTQQPYLFSMDIKNNLRYANESRDESELRHLLHVSGFRNIIEIFPDELETEVGEKGVSLSGGQKQRLSLARTLTKPCDILILDDFTSALDKNTEKWVMANILELLKDKTCFFITHRLETMYHADKVVVISENGTIETFGTPQEVVSKSDYIKSIL
jgi:ATP-binding cassette subfamily B protein